MCPITVYVEVRFLLATRLSTVCHRNRLLSSFPRSDFTCPLIFGLCPSGVVSLLKIFVVYYKFQSLDHLLLFCSSNETHQIHLSIRSVLRTGPVALSLTIRHFQYASVLKNKIFLRCSIVMWLSRYCLAVAQACISQVIKMVSKIPYRLSIFC